MPASHQQAAIRHECMSRAKKIDGIALEICGLITGWRTEVCGVGWIPDKRFSLMLIERLESRGLRSIAWRGGSPPEQEFPRRQNMRMDRDVCQFNLLSPLTYLGRVRHRICRNEMRRNAGIEIRGGRIGHR